MKKRNMIFGILALAGSTILAACGAPESASVGPSSMETERNFAILAASESGGVVQSGANITLLFKANSEIPYVSLKNGFGFINMVKGVRANDPKNESHYYRISKEGGNFVVTEEHGAKATFDPQNKTVSFTDFDTFVALSNGKSTTPGLVSAIRGNVKSLSVSDVSFQPGKAVTFDFKPYSSIDFYTKGEDLYLPFTTFFDMTYHVYESVVLAYNYQNVYLLNYNELASREDGKVSVSALGRSFYGGTKMATLTDEIKQYHYQEACFNFDYLYGLKKEKGFSSFAGFLEDKGLKDSVLSSDPKTADASLRYALSHLVDGHTNGATPSCLYDFGTSIDDDAKINAERAAWVKYGDDLIKARKAAGLSAGTYLDEQGKAFYISFDSFTEINESVLYSQSGAPTNTAVFFSQAYKTLSSEATRAKVETIVVDLLTNDGGAAESMMYGLCSLLGEVKTVTYSSVSGAQTRGTYKADLNLDGQIDDKDVPLIKKGYNIVFLDSKATFSCGNAMPAIAKANSDKVLTAGETSGGGTCVVRPYFTAIGAGVSTSGVTTVATENGGTLSNVEKGVPADIALESAEFFNRTVISEKINQRLNLK